MFSTRRCFTALGFTLGCGSPMGLIACHSGSGAGTGDASKEASSDARADAHHADAHGSDAHLSDARMADRAPSTDGSVVGIEITLLGGGPLQGAPGDALQLLATLKLRDGGTSTVPYSEVKWMTPTTVVAQNPEDAGPNSALPEAGAGPMAFFVSNEYRITQEGVLFLTATGTPAEVTVTAMVPGAGTASAKVTVLAAPTGDATRGQNLFQSLLPCAGCHGMTAGGSPPVDAGEAGVEYQLPIGPGGELFPYPAPPLSNTTTDAGPNLAADPTWSAGLLGMAAQADIDNNGVALRPPMPTFFDTSDGTGKNLGAQDFADIYAWLKTQTQ